MVDMMAAGQMNGLFCQGLNIMLASPDKNKVMTGLAKLKWMVVIDPLETETARFWENHGEFNNVDPKSIQTEVIQLPASAYAEEEGSCTNSSRVIMWHWKAADGPGESRSDIEIISELHLRLRALYAKDGGAFPDPIVKLDVELHAAAQSGSGGSAEGDQRLRHRGHARSGGSGQGRCCAPASCCRPSA